jgi:hypothetical protein
MKSATLLRKFTSRVSRAKCAAVTHHHTKATVIHRKYVNEISWLGGCLNRKSR